MHVGRVLNPSFLVDADISSRFASDWSLASEGGFPGQSLRAPVQQYPKPPWGLAESLLRLPGGQRYLPGRVVFSEEPKSQGFPNTGKGAFAENIPTVPAASSTS